MRDMWTSISAIEDAGGKEGNGGCLRRWWFTKCMKLPIPKKKATIFGDVHHAVIARYLLADDRGLFEGKPVIIYPPNWMSMSEKWGSDKTIYTIEPAEAALIKVLIDTAITNGILVREPGRIIEKPVGDYMYTNDKGEKQFGRVLLSEGNIRKTKVVLKGLIDLETPLKIQDHKTTKSTEYVLSANKLRRNIQLMTYAMDKYERGHKGNLWLAHNSYIKDFDKPQVIQREIEVTQNDVYLFFADVTMPLVKKMFDIYIKYGKEKIKLWRDIPPANDPMQECNHHYGKPCPFIGICTDTCTLENYLIKFEGVNVKDYVEIDEPNKNIFNSKENSNMSSLIDRIKAQQAANAQGTVAAVATAQPAQPAPAPVQAPAVAQPASAATGGALSSIMEKIKQQKALATQALAQPAPAPAPASAPIPEAPPKQRAPWYTEYGGLPCSACKDNEVQGFNSKGEPCQICVARAAHAGVPGPDSYDIGSNDKGELVFTPKATPAAEPVKVKVTKSGKAKATSESASTPTAQPQLMKALDSIEKIQASAPAGKGFTLLLGCALIAKAGGSEDVIHADDLLKDTMSIIAEAAGKPTATIEHFETMSAIDAYLPAIVETLAGKTVLSFVPGKGTALARLVDGLRPFATRVIVPLGI